MIGEELLKSAWQIIKEAKNILLVVHNHPDGDTLASANAMAIILRDHDKTFSIFCADKPPRQFDFLPFNDSIVTNKSILDFSNFDLIVTLDCGSLKKTGIDDLIAEKSLFQKIMEFDHHPKVDDFADYELRDPSAAAASEIIYRFFKANDLTVNKEVANSLLVGIATDTGFFLYPSTSKDTIEAASEMLKKGASLPKIVENAWRNKSLQAMKLWGTAINNLTINKKYSIAYTVLTLEEINGNPVSNEELEGISGFLSNLEGVKGVVLLREEEPGVIRGNLRTNHNLIDISKLAHKLGGGGHAKASGFMIGGRIEQINENYRVIDID